MARSTDFDLVAALATPSFTPGQRHVPALVDLIAAGNDRAAAALAGLGATARGALQAKLAATTDEATGARLVAALGLIARAGDADAQRLVLERVGDPAVRVRKAAISALGKLGGDAARDAVVARWDAADVTADERRVLTEALGKLGGQAALARLAAIDSGDDRELARRRDRALLMADRSAKRDAPSTIATDVAPPAPVVVVLRCRGGLGPLLGEELTALGMQPRAITDASAELTLAKPWSALFASRLWASAAIRIRAPQGNPPAAAGRRGDRGDRVANPEQLASSIVEVLLAPTTRALLAAWTRGPIRWRLGFTRGHKRAIVWRVASAVAAAAPALINDPQQTTWDVQVDDATGAIELAPKRFDDPRWAWRVAEVPAASHPSVAAALVHLAALAPGEEVWDPFCGSGLELIEAAAHTKGAMVYGSDLDDAALAAAARNVAAAGVTARLACSDARVYSCYPVAAIVTNPPLGSRVQVDAAALLVDAVDHFARQLGDGGRLVWITPAPRKTTPAAEAAGLVRVRSLAIDLGGVYGHLERWNKPAS